MIKSRIAKNIYYFFEWLDRKLGYYERFKGETAPYCGYGYSGHTGRFTESYYDEVAGYRCVSIGKRYLYIGNDDYYEKPEEWIVVIQPFWRPVSRR